MADFRTQIDEDIAFYKEAFPHVTHIEKPEWAFNFWVLDKLFSEDEDEIENKIVDYADNGIDCYVWHEEAKDLYLIQNKYYSDDTPLTKSYFNTSIQDGYGQLLEGTYARSNELQTIFSKYRTDPDFYVYHYYYVTNNNRSDSVDAAVQAFNQRNAEKKRIAKVFFLDDIEEAYYRWEPKKQERHLTITVETINKGTQLSVNNEAYGLALPIDAQYIMLPVATLYRALVLAEKEKYPIFDANIREYLGTGKSVNKRIISTLEDKDERKKFFFYNNGITIICSNAESWTEGSRRRIKLVDPQIVNGCQTVSSIKHVLESVPEGALEKEFSDTFVMAKILEIPKQSDEQEAQLMEELRKDIVKYNNSQNSIDEKTFVARDEPFIRLQTEFRKHGFLLLLKQSDQNTFAAEYKKPTELKARAQKKLELFNLTESVTKTRDFMISLEKFLQVVLAFKGDAQQAFQKKGRLLVGGSSQHEIVMKAISDTPELTTQRLLSLYLLYLRAEKTKTAGKEDGRTPIPWYLIEGFSKIDGAGSDYTKIDSLLNGAESIDRLIKLYRGATKMYLADYVKNNPGKDYNAMIKDTLDVEKLKGFLDVASAMAF